MHKIKESENNVHPKFESIFNCISCCFFTYFYSLVLDSHVLVAWTSNVDPTRPALSQLRSLKIGRSAKFM